MTYTIKFLPSGREIQSELGDTVLEAAQAAGVFIESPCGGNGKCGKCKIMMSERTGPCSEDEVALIPENERESGVRLACRTPVDGDLSVFIPDEYVVAREVSQKTFSGRVTHPRPAVVSFRLEVPHTLANEDVTEATVAAMLRDQHGVDGVIVDGSCVTDLAGTLNDPISALTAYVWMDKEVIGLTRGIDEAMLGAAVDIGTTTVAIYLCDLNTGDILGSGSFANPQIMFGGDVISRIAYSVKNRDSGIDRMRAGLLRAINTLLGQLAAAAGSDISHILDIVAVGNTVMHHIFLGVRPDRLGLSPFRPAITSSVDVKARDLGLAVDPASFVHVLPVEAGFVGADNVAVILSEEPYRKDNPELIVDIGTNGEIVLGDRSRLFSCSCATGPALEGAGISRGMRAIRGAIERVRIDRSTLDVDYQVVGEEGWARTRETGALKPIGICGSGIIDAVAELYSAGIIDGKGTFVDKLETGRLRKNGSGSREFVLARREETGTGADIAITQRDIRQFQLAKGALRAGCEILMKRYGIDSVGRIVIAGAFGVHIDKFSAIVTGLFPPCDPDAIYVAGNAAGHGAYLALMDREKREEADTIARKTQYVELASDPEFQPTFLKALFIPYEP